MKIKELTTKDTKNIMMDKALAIVSVLVIIEIIIIEPSFLQVRILTDALTQSTAKMICVLELIFALLLGGVGLSGGHQVGLVAVMITSLLQMADYSNKFWSGLPEFPIIIPVIMTLALVAMVGAVNDFMTVKLRVAPFTATFDISTTVYGISCLYFAKKPNNSQPIGGMRNSLTVLSNFKILGQTFFLVVAAATAIVDVWFLLNKTIFGKNIYTVGGNPEVAKISGINVSKVIIIIFIIEPVFVGLTGILEVARTGGVNSAYGDVYGFDAISSYVVGGVSLSGGVGKVSGVITGVLTFTLISYGLTYIGVNSNWQLIVKGLIIHSAVVLDTKKSS